MHRLIHSLLIFTFASIYPIHVAVGKEKPVTDASQIQQIEDRTAIRNVIDTFSNLADEKKIDKQLLLFTEDAIIDSHVKGVSVGVIQGRKAIGQAFTSYLSLFDVVRASCKTRVLLRIYSRGRATLRKCGRPFLA